MNMYQVYVPVNQIVARRSAELHQAQKCRICLSNRNLREIYTGGDQFRQQLIEQHSTRLLAAHELPRFICEGCEDVMIFYQTLVSKRERAESLMQTFVFGGGAWPEVQEMELSDEDDSDSELDSSEEEEEVAQHVRPVVKVEADSTTESVPDAVLRTRVFEREGLSSTLERNDDPFDGILDAVIQRQLNGPSPPEAQPFDAIFDVIMGRHQARAQNEDNDSDDDIELVNEYNLNPF